MCIYICTHVLIFDTVIYKHFKICWLILILLAMLWSRRDNSGMFLLKIKKCWTLRGTLSAKSHRVVNSRYKIHIPHILPHSCLCPIPPPCSIKCHVTQREGRGVFVVFLNAQGFINASVCITTKFYTILEAEFDVLTLKWKARLRGNRQWQSLCSTPDQLDSLW